MASAMDSKGEEPLLPRTGRTQLSVMVERLRGPHASQPAETDAEVVTLYHGYKDGSLNCIFSCKVRALCEMCGVRYRLIDIDLADKPDWFVNISPKEEVPVAYVKGELLQDSGEIVAAVKSLVMDDGVGRPDAADFLQRESALSAEAVGGVLGTFFGYFVCPPGSEGEAAAREKWEALVGQYEAVLRSSDYLCGSSLGPVDALEFPLLRLCPDILEVSHGWRRSEKCPRLLAWIDRLSEELDWALIGLAEQASQVEVALSGLSKKMPNAVHVADAAKRARDALLGASRESVMVERLRGPHASQPAETDAEVVTLYHGYKDGSLNCIFSCKVRALCEMCGVRYRLIDIDLADKPDWFVNISPKEEVPVAYVKGELLQDSGEIVAAVKSLVMDDGVGRPDAADFLQRESALSAEAVGGVLGTFFGYFVCPPGSEGEAAAREKWEALVGQYEAVLRSSDYLCGSSLGPVDALEFPLLRLCPDILEVSHGWRRSEKCPRLLAWIDRLSEELDWALIGLAEQASQVEVALSGLSKKMPNAVHVADAAKRARDALLGASRESVMVERLRGPHASPPLFKNDSVMTLYHGYASGNLMCIYSLKVRWLAEELGVRYRIVDIDLTDKPSWFHSISPSLTCPVASVEGRVLADSIHIIASLIELAGKGAVEHPEFALRQSYCSIDVVTAERAVSEMGAFSKFVLTPPESVDAPAALVEWEQSVRVFEQCLRNSGKPFLCGDSPGRLDAEVVFWRTALPLVELAVGWKNAERAPFMSTWVKRMESLDSMKRATDGAASLEALVADKLQSLSEQFPMAHLKKAAQHAQKLVEASDPEKALIRKVQSFCDAVSINNDCGHQTIVLQFVKSAFMEQVKKTQPRRHYTLEEWQEDVLASVEHKKMILQSMVANVAFKVSLLQHDTTNAITPWMRAAQDGCVLALVELHGNNCLSAKTFLSSIDAHRNEFLHLGLIGAAIPEKDVGVVLGLGEEPEDSSAESSNAIFPQAVVFEAAPDRSGSDEENEQAETKDKVAPLSMSVKAHTPRTKVASPPKLPVRLSPADKTPTLVAFCAQPGETGTTKQRNPAMATQRTTRSTRSSAKHQSPKPEPQKLIRKSASENGGGGTAVGNWRRAGNAVRAANTFTAAEKVQKRQSKEKAVMHVASSRRMKRWHPKNWYFLLLEVGWGQLVVIFCGIYGAVW
jgi:glutathione S-transferase